MASAWVLPTILGLPLIGAILVMLIPRSEAGLARGFGFGFSLATFCISLAILGYFDSEYGRFQLVVDKEWIPGLNAHFKVGVDGISLWLVILTTFTTPIAILSAYRAVDKHVREFIAAMLILEVGMLGAFVALDMFLFYIFWEVMLIPMYFLIGIWGGKRRIYASIKFVIYTMAGSLLMLVAIFYMYAKHGAITGEYTTDFVALQKNLVLSSEAQFWCFAAFGLAFAIKVPLFPLHTWLPDAHVEAPTAGSVILAGLLLKFGIYGFIRFAMPMFPAGSQAWAPLLAILAVVGIIYGAYVAFAQPDVKKLVAYSSVSHLGFCVLGVFAMTAMGIEGSIYAMLSHGLTTGGLFLAIGVLYERRHTRRLAEFGGLWKQMPVFAGIFLIITLGSAGLPGLSGFIGEFLTIFGTFVASDASIPVPRLLAALAATGVIFGAVYLLYMFQKMMFGPITHEANRTLKDLSGREIAVFLPIVAMVFFMGIYPRPFLKSMEPAVERFMTTYHTKLAQTRDQTYVPGVSPKQARAAESSNPGALVPRLQPAVAASAPAAVAPPADAQAAALQAVAKRATAPPVAVDQAPAPPVAVDQTAGPPVATKIDPQTRVAGVKGALR
ncbi:MAG: NADH-quinone oxidoreductase subunit M [Proteobacteria bacterium]|nr:NADH-quinone oxidoreductase subunit M [Pseudomonadota bacterium]